MIDISKFRYSLKAFIAFEQAMGHSFGDGTPLTDTITLMYCFYIAAGGEEMTFEEFVAELDADEGKLQEFTAWLARKGQVIDELSSKKKATEQS